MITITSSLFPSVTRVSRQANKEASKDAVQRNVFFADPASLDQAQFAVRALNEFKAKPFKKPILKLLRGIRKATVPTLNWGSSKWTEIIEWDTIKLLQEPQILARLTAGGSYFCSFGIPGLPLSLLEH